MAAKELHFNVDARAALKRGVDQVAEEGVASHLTIGDHLQARPDLERDRLVRGSGGAALVDRQRAAEEPLGVGVPILRLEQRHDVERDVRERDATVRGDVPGSERVADGGNVVVKVVDVHAAGRCSTARADAGTYRGDDLPPEGCTRRRGSSRRCTLAPILFRQSARSAISGSQAALVRRERPLAVAAHITSASR